jgi:transcriptional regulator with XRE-family HTH domain
VTKIGDAVKKLRKERGFSQMGLAKKVGISNSYLCDIESNRDVPSYKRLKLIANAMDMTVPELLAHVDEGES